MKRTTIFAFALLMLFTSTVSAEFPTFFKLGKTYKLHLSDGRFFVGAMLVRGSSSWVEISYQASHAINSYPGRTFDPATDERYTIWINMDHVTSIKETIEEKAKPEKEESGNEGAIRE